MSQFTLRPWLRLCRLPTVFTALADICVGFLLTHSTWSPSQEFWCLIGASAGLYLSGMVFNDVFDVLQDQMERPQRPIPSGAIQRSGAIVFGSLLMIAGIVCAAMASWISCYLALLIALAVLIYDGGLKRTPLGPVGMGTCRLLNILLGASSSVATFPEVWQMPQLWMALSMGVYITGVTWFAQTEAKTSRRSMLAGALLLANLGLGMLALWICQLTKNIGIDLGPAGFPGPMPVMFLWAVIFLSINRRAVAAIAEPVPSRVQPAIGSMLLSIISIDAMMIYFHLGPTGLIYSLWTLALFLPAIVLRRWIPMT